MKDHGPDQGHPMPAQPGAEHLDLVTAELRRRIAGIGLAIAELREETGRLRAAADSRRSAVAVLDRPPRQQPPVAQPVDASAPVGSSSPRAATPRDVAGTDGAAIAVDVALDTTIAAVRDDQVSIVVSEDDPVAEPTPPWRVASVQADVASDSGPAPSELAWVPETAAAPTAPAPRPSVAPEPATQLRPTPGPTDVSTEPSPWPASDDVDEAKFDAFFSAEVDPEPSQRWLLSD